jgi:hypothetical protein
MAEYAISTAETATGCKLSLVIPVYCNAGSLPDVGKAMAWRDTEPVTGEYTRRIFNQATRRPESVIEAPCF